MTGETKDLMYVTMLNYVCSRTDSFALAAVNKANRMTKQMQRHYCGNKVTENSTFYRDILLLHLHLEL